MKRMISSRAAQILAVGLCWLAITGCNQAFTANKEVTMAELNRALGVLSIGAGAPQTIDVLTNFPPFKGRPFPVPPAGKKFIIDPATCTVVAVSK